MPYSNSGYKSVNKKFIYVFTFVHHSLIANNQPYLVLPIRNSYQLHAILSSVLYSSYPACLGTWDGYSLIAKLTHWIKGLASLHTGLLITCCICLDMMLPFSTAKQCQKHLVLDIGITPPRWCHHNFIQLLSNTDLNDDFIQPPAEQVLQLISNIKHRPAKHTR